MAVSFFERVNWCTWIKPWIYHKSLTNYHIKYRVHLSMDGNQTHNITSEIPLLVQVDVKQW